jgi:hypothetical protein
LRVTNPCYNFTLIATEGESRRLHGIDDAADHLRRLNGNGGFIVLNEIAVQNEDLC